MQKLIASLAVCVTIGPLLARPATAAECATYFRSHRYGLPEFHRSTKFGTVGIATSQRQRIAVPINGCITLTRPQSVYVYFNHRNSRSSGVGYVSFKLYGITGSPDWTVLKLARKGEWLHANSPLRPVPWDPTPLNVDLATYEAFYSAPNPSETDFTSKFGDLHGTPAGSTLSSWTALARMQPSQKTMSEFGSTIEPSKTGYLMHNLQRVEVTEGAEVSNDPSYIVTDRTEFDALIVSVYSPLSESAHQTIVIKFSR